MFTTDSSVRMFELILMSGRNSRTPICDKKKEKLLKVAPFRQVNSLH